MDTDNEDMTTTELVNAWLVGLVATTLLGSAFSGLAWMISALGYGGDDWWAFLFFLLTLYLGCTAFIAIARVSIDKVISCAISLTAVAVSVLKNRPHRL